jgi:tRNA 5-methylaminomethyl-2-thiouridine biosynthesis bifunctional protein
VGVPEVQAWLNASTTPPSTEIGPQGWLFPQGGWVSPKALVEALLRHPGISIRTVSVERLVRSNDPARWTLTFKDSDPESFDLVVLANGTGLGPLLSQSGLPCPELAPVRGQLSWVTELPPGSTAPRALTGLGYAAPCPEGGLSFGATAQLNDPDPALRLADHQFNVQRLRQLTGIDLPAHTPWQGRVGWRVQSKDKLPLLGTLPDLEAWAAGGRRDQARLIPRLEGLYLCGALGSRGLAWAPLAADQITAWISGEPPLLENDLLEGLDPTRFWVRQARKSQAVSTALSGDQGDQGTSSEPREPSD